ncbi:MAG: GspH/FimT family pseudopilin [Rudaea sp.]
MSDVHGNYSYRSAASAHGFTLIELMITIFVAFILLALALPSFRDTIMSNHVTETTNALITDLNLARSEAVHRGTLVAVVSDSGSNDWSGGWKVIADSAFKNDGTFTDATDAILHVNSGVDTADHYSVKTKVTTVAGTGITPTDGTLIFTSQGNLVSKAAGFDINVCRPDSKPSKSKRITIVTSGMLSTKTDTGGSPAPGC